MSEGSWRVSRGYPEGIRYPVSYSRSLMKYRLVPRGVPDGFPMVAGPGRNSSILLIWSAVVGTLYVDT